MFPAVFAVLLLGHFVTAEIYVGQNPQNVNAVIKDANGNLVPVTGVADEIVVVDLNYGGKENSSGMSVEVSVSPVNGTSSSSVGYPPLGYPSSISMPSESSSTQISTPPPSASSITLPSSSAPFSLPSASSTPPIWNLSSVAAPNQSSISNLGSSNSASGASSFPSSSGLGLGLNIPPTGTSPPAQPSIFNPPREPPSKSPVSEYDNLVSDLSEPSSTKTGVPSPSNGSKNKKSGPFSFFNPFGKPKNDRPAASLFVELGGSLGPVVNPVNLTPVNVSNPFVSNLTTSIPHHKNRNKNNPFFDVNNMMMNWSSPFQFPPNTNATSLNDILGSLFNSSTISMQPVNGAFMPLTKMMKSIMNSSQSIFNPGNSNASPFSSLMNSFMNPSALLSHLGGANSSLFPDLLNSFMNSSLFNSSSANSSFDDMMNSFSSANGLPFSGLSGLFSPSSSPFSKMLTSPFGESMLTPTNASSISNLMSSFFGGNSSIFNFTSPSFISGNSTDLKGMLQSFLPPSMLGGSDDEEYDPDYPEDDIYKDLNSESSDSDSDDEDYYNPLPSLLPPKKSSSVPSSVNISGSDIISSELPTIDGIENMMNNLLTPAANGTTSLTSLLDGIFSSNGTALSSMSPFALGNLFNPMTFMNGTSFNLTSAFENFKPFSNIQKIISFLNSTGLFGNLSDLSELVQNTSSIVTEAMNNVMNNKITSPADLNEIINDIMSMWKKLIPILQTLMKNISFKPPTMNPIPQSIPLMHSSPSASMPMPRGIGTSFLALPTSLPAPVISEPLQSSDMQASAPAPEGAPSPAGTSTSAPVSPETSTSPQPTTVQNNSTGSGTPTPTPPTNTNGTKTSPNAGGINSSSIWITLIGCLFVTFSQKGFLRLM